MKVQYIRENAWMLYTIQDSLGWGRTQEMGDYQRWNDSPGLSAAPMNLYFSWSLSLFFFFNKYPHHKKAIVWVSVDFLDTRGCQRFYPSLFYNTVIFYLEVTVRKTSNPTHAEVKNRQAREYWSKCSQRMLFH